jgi:hypothetical protein
MGCRSTTRERFSPLVEPSAAGTATAAVEPGHGVKLATRQDRPDAVLAVPLTVPSGLREMTTSASVGPPPPIPVPRHLRQASLQVQSR